MVLRSGEGYCWRGGGGGGRWCLGGVGGVVGGVEGGGVGPRRAPPSRTADRRAAICVLPHLV